MGDKMVLTDTTKSKLGIGRVQGTERPLFGSSVEHCLKSKEG
jgi:hypothetical protein